MIAVVLGTARSGTSLVAGLLHYLGIDMGHRNDPRDDQNPHGGFESPAWVDLSSKWVQGSITLQELQDRAHDLISGHSTGTPWGFKSALSHRRPEKGGKSLIEILTSTSWEFQPRILAVTRNPMRTALSWQRQQLTRYSKAITTAEALHHITRDTAELAQTLMMLRAHGLRVLWLTFEELKAQPRVEIGRILYFLNLDAHPGRALRFIEGYYSTILDTGFYFERD